MTPSSIRRFTIFRCRWPLRRGLSALGAPFSAAARLDNIDRIANCVKLVYYVNRACFGLLSTRATKSTYIRKQRKFEQKLTKEAKLQKIDDLCDLLCGSKSIPYFVSFC